MSNGKIEAKEFTNYVPTVSGDWLAPPTNCADALDELSAGSASAGVSGALGSQSTPLDAQTALLTHLDGTLADSSANANTLTSSGVSYVSGEFSQGAQFAGGASNIQALNTGAIYDTPSADFTIDFWANPTLAATQTYCAYADNASNLAWTLFSFASGNLRFIVLNPGGSAFVDFAAAAATITAGVWQHIAAVRSGSTWLLFVNGIQVATTTTAGTVRTLANSAINMGCEFSGSQPYTGALDEFRFSNGVARWTSNFTPPTAPYGAALPGVYTVSTARVAANSTILLTHNTVGGTQGILSAPAASIVPGTSFQVTSSNSADTSTVNWAVLAPKA